MLINQDSVGKFFNYTLMQWNPPSSFLKLHPGCSPSSGHKANMSWSMSPCRSTMFLQPWPKAVLHDIIHKHSSNRLLVKIKHAHTLPAFLHIWPVIRSGKHGYRETAVLGWEAVLENPRDGVIKHIERELGGKKHKEKSVLIGIHSILKCYSTHWSLPKLS